MPPSRSDESRDPWIVVRDIFLNQTIPTRRRVSEAARRCQSLSESQLRRYFKALELAQKYRITGPMRGTEWDRIQEDPEWAHHEHITQTMIEKAGSLLHSSAAPIPADLRFVWDKHVQGLLDIAQEIRKLLHNPHPEVEAYLGPSHPGALLPYGKGDWVLYPKGWLERVVPDFEDPALWGDLFPAFRQHAEQSPFWTHLEELHAMAVQLDAEVTDACEHLVRQEPSLSRSWDRWKKYRDTWDLHVSVNQTFGTSDSENDAPPHAQFFSTEKVRAALMQHFLLELPKRTAGLWRLLEQCRDDLMPERIGPVLVGGRCDLCRTWDVPTGGAPTAARPRE